MTRDTCAALVLVAAFLWYGFGATRIDVIPGQHAEAFSPRTLPYMLTAIGVLLGLVQVLRTLCRPATVSAGRPLDWRRAAAVCSCMIGYGFLFTRLGFVVATALFLCAAFAVLGERRFTILLLLPTLFSIAFWALITRVLGLYLAPGSWLQVFSG